MRPTLNRTRFADSEGRYGNTFWHLRDRQQGILTTQIFGRHRHTQHRHDRFRCDHAGQMRSATGTRNNYFHSAGRSIFSKLRHLLRHAVCGESVHFKGDLELIEDLCGFLHDRPVACAAHDDADEWFHMFGLFSVKINLFSQQKRFFHTISFRFAR